MAHDCNDGADSHAQHVQKLTDFADRLDELASTADLMGDDDSARHWRSKANEVRLRAMTDLDE